MHPRPVDTTEVKSSPSRQQVGRRRRQSHFFPGKTVPAHVTQHTGRVQGGRRKVHARVGRARPWPSSSSSPPEARLRVGRLDHPEHSKLSGGWGVCGGDGRGGPCLKLSLLRQVSDGPEKPFLCPLGLDPYPWREDFMAHTLP